MKLINVARRRLLETVLPVGLLLLLACSLEAQPIRTSPRTPKKKALFPRPEQPLLNAHEMKTSALNIEIGGTCFKTDQVQLKVIGQRGAKTYEDEGGDGNFIFSFDVVLLPNQLNRIVVTPFNHGVRGPAIKTQVLHDNKPPKIIIETPEEGVFVTSNSIAVAGRFEDASASCDFDLTLGNRSPLVLDGPGGLGTFSISDAQLVQDPDFPNDPNQRLLRYTATDGVNNTLQGSRKLTRQAPAAAQRILTITDGNNQLGAVEQELPGILAVQLSGPGNHDNRLVTFKVTSGSGGLSELLGGPTARMRQIRTDQNGVATIRFVLGKKAGAGVHRVTATARDYAPAPVFIASGIPLTDLWVTHNDGHVRVGEPGTLGDPLRVLITDEFGNRINNILVTFKVTAGKARFSDGTREITVISGANFGTRNRGRADVNFKFGPGSDKSTIEADFMGNTHGSAVFTLHSEKPRQGKTLIAGIVRDRAGRPLSGASVNVEGAGWKTMPTAVTDSKGRYRIVVTESGPATVKITKNNPMTGIMAMRTKDVTVVTGNTHRIPNLHIDTNSELDEVEVLDDGSEVVIETKGTKTTFNYVPGSARGKDGTTPTPQNPFRIRITEIPTNKTDVMLSQSIRPLIAFDVQGDRTICFDEPMSFTMPNLTGLPPGTIVIVWGIDPFFGTIGVVGTGKVSENGNKIFATGVKQTGFVAVSTTGPKFTTVQGQVNTQFQTTIDPCLSFLYYDRLAAFPCQSLFDGTLQGFQNYIACVQDLNQAMDQMASNATTSTPLSDPEFQQFMEWLTKQLTKDLFLAKRALDSENPPPPDCNEIQLSTESFEVSQLGDSTKFKVINYVVTVTFSTDPSLNGIEPGDAVVLDPAELEVFDFELRRLVDPRARNAVTLTVDSVDPGFGQTGLILTVKALFPEEELLLTGNVNGRTGDVDPATGCFEIQHVLVREDEPVVYRLDFYNVPLFEEYETCDRPLSSRSVYSVVDGMTDVGMIELDSLQNDPDSLNVSPEQIAIVEGQAGSATCLATNADGTVNDITFVETAAYRTSADFYLQNNGDGMFTGTGKGEATLSVAYEGLVGTVNVSVDGPDGSTTVEGFVETSPGAYVAGATVTVYPDGVSTTSNATGFFTINFTPEGQDEVLLSVGAQLDGDPLLQGLEDGFQPVINGFTDVGTILMQPATVWVNDGDGFFDVGSNWSGGVVPDQNTIAVIDRMTDPIITVRDQRQIRRLVSQETISIVFPGNLTITEPWILLKGLELGGGRLSDTVVIPGPNNAEITPTSGLSTLDNINTYVNIRVDDQTLKVENGLDLNAILYVTASTGASVEWRGQAQTVQGSGCAILQGPQQRARLFPKDNRVTFNIPLFGEFTMGLASSQYTLNNTVTSDVIGGKVTLTGDRWVNNSLIHGKCGGNLEIKGTNYTNNGEIRQETGQLTTVDEPEGPGRIQVLGADWDLQGVYSNYFDALDTEADKDSRITLQGLFLLESRTFNTDFFPVEWLLNGTIKDGTITGSNPLIAQTNPCTLDNVTISTNSVVEIKNGVSLNVVNDTVVDGKVDIGGINTLTALLFVGDESRIDGEGSVCFGVDTFLNSMSAVSGGSLTIGATITITGGSGIVGSSTSTCKNEGTVEATTPGERIELRNVDNRGTMRTAQGATIATLGAYLQILGLTDNEGTISASGGFNFAGGSVTGSGTFSGNVTNRGQVNLAATAGPSNFNGSYTQDSMGDLRVEIGSDTQFGSVTVSGAALLDGTLTLSFLNGYVPTVGFIFQIMNFASSSGDFSQIIGGQVGNVHLVAQFEIGFLQLLVVPN